MENMIDGMMGRDKYGIKGATSSFSELFVVSLFCGTLKFITVMTDDRKDEIYYAAIELLQRQVRALAPRCERRAVADLWESQLQQDGYETHREGNQVWAVAAAYDESLPTLLLEVGIDMSLPAGEWSRDPYEPVEDECCLYGIGINRFGASAVSLWAAFRLLSGTPQPYNMIFWVSCKGGEADVEELDSVWQHLPKPDFAVVGQPTDMRPAVSERGYMRLGCEVKGKAGSVAKGDGVNAIYKALPALAALQDFHLERLSVTLGEVKFTAASIEAAADEGMVPDSCRFMIEVRANDCYTNDEILSLLQAALPCEMTPMPGVAEASHIDMQHPFVRRAELLGCEPFGSSARSDRAYIDCPSVGIGPGEPEPVAGDEFIRLADVREAIEMFVNLLDDLQLSTPEE